MAYGSTDTELELQKRIADLADTNAKLCIRGIEKNRRIAELEARLEKYANHNAVVRRENDKMQDRIAELKARWELMKADRDKWKARVNEPYDESVMAENITLKATIQQVRELFRQQTPMAPVGVMHVWADDLDAALGDKPQE